MKSTAHAFRRNVHVALHDERLQRALGRVGGGFIEKRRAAVDALPEFESLRAAARAVKDHTLAHLDEYLERFEARVVASGGQVHWAASAAEARRIVIELCREAGAHRVTKGKTMVGEEIGINEALVEAGFEPVETDLGEYIIQLAGEPPSHIIAPAIHKTRSDIAELFRQHHHHRQALESARAIVDEAREVMRERFLSADVGITGANFLVADTGSVVLVTNEGNGDLTATVPRSHIVLAGIEKVVPTLEDASVLLRLLARSATGQAFTAYTTVFTGPRRPQDQDGPAAFHVVLVDNGRSDMLGGEYRDMLRCIRCGACLNHCPVYGAVGGHAYGWVYPGPMGSVLTPLILGLKEAGDLPNASTLCGRCEAVCPVSIPLPMLLRRLRVRQHAEGLAGRTSRWALALWAFTARRPGLYAPVMGLGVRILAWLGGGRGRLRRLPGASAWTDS
ncbi:MAG: LutB/LldF family L-lactate oxidation iron-sulfur protein, partial [Gammaproteobacteria bacterium]